MLRGLRWDQMKRRLAAVVVIATMALPGVASAEEAPTSQPAESTISFDTGDYVGSFGGMYYSRGTSWS